MGSCGMPRSPEPEKCMMPSKILALRRSEVCSNGCRVASATVHAPPLGSVLLIQGRLLSGVLRGLSHLVHLHPRLRSSKKRIPKNTQKTMPEKEVRRRNPHPTQTKENKYIGSGEDRLHKRRMHLSKFQQKDFAQKQSST